MYQDNLRLALVLAVSSITVGTVGYRYIEGWTWLESFWMVLITVTTIGYGELHELSDAGRIFTIGLIFCGLSIGIYTASQLTRYMLEGDLWEDLRAERRRRTVARLKDHFIIVGYGRLGHEVAEELVHAGQPVVVVDVHRGPLEDPRYAALNLPWIHGDAAHDSVLQEAGVSGARGLAVATGSDATNVLVTLSARQLNPKLLIYARVDDPENESKARLAGANHVINPYLSGATRMAQGMLRPHARDFVELVMSRTYQGLAMEDIPLQPGTDCVGPLATLELRRRFGVMVVAVRKADGELMPMPDADTTIAAGDVVVVVGKPADILRFGRAVGG
ncbi:MAG: potassium channel protein [Alphaproteobacteria bacterium]|nr:potassium channel protein [Alphaproteobacteria bacterium]